MELAKSKMSLELPKKEQNVPSSLLTQEENQKIFYALGKHCKTLATAVVQLYHSEKPNLSRGKKYNGVVCFVKDFDRRSFFIKLFDMDKSCWIWEKELDISSTYKTAFIHIFETDDCMVVLIFENNDEALNFKSAVQKKLQQRDERKRERRRRQPPPPPPFSAVGTVATGGNSESTPFVFGKESRRKEREKRKKKITKEDVSHPTNLTPVEYVRWHPEKGFNVESMDDELKAFFNMAGVSDNDLNDEETRNFIYDFIANHGGLELSKKQIVQKGPKPPPPPHPAATVPSAAQPPQIPEHSGTLPLPPPPKLQAHNSATAYTPSPSPSHGPGASSAGNTAVVKYSRPSNPETRHVEREEWHPEKSFNVESMDEELKAFFDMAGVSDDDLEENDTCNFLFDIIPNHGGLERVKQEMRDVREKRAQQEAVLKGEDQDKNEDEKDKDPKVNVCQDVKSFVCEAEIHPLKFRP